MQNDPNFDSVRKMRAKAKKWVLLSREFVKMK
jgi:hypothetical protein